LEKHEGEGDKILFIFFFLPNYPFKKKSGFFDTKTAWQSHNSSQMVIFPFLHVKWQKNTIL